MKTHPSRNVPGTRKRKRKAYHVASLGRVKVPIYKRVRPDGTPGFMVANYATGKRRFDSYATDAEAIEAANKLARQLSEQDVTAAKMTERQAMEYAVSVDTLKSFGVTLTAVTEAVKECFKHVAGLAEMQAAAKFYEARHKRTTPKRVLRVVAEILKIKKSRGASQRYTQDLRQRLSRFAKDFKCETGNVTTAEIQAWLNRQKFGTQSYKGYRTVLSTFFKFAMAQGYASDNPVEGVERVKVRSGDVEIFTPAEIVRLLGAAKEGFTDYLPCLAIGAFAGLRSAEIERLEWSDIHLAEKFIVVGASKAKTASRRIVPIHDNLAAWLAPYAERHGKVWRGTHDDFYDHQQEIAAATIVDGDVEKNIPAQKAVKWKANGLRHSYASYRFAQIGDAGRVAGECGNSAAVIHRHYRELVKPSDAVKWFAVSPKQPENVVAIGAESRN